MAKLPHQSTVPPVNAQDTVNKNYGDSNYSGGGGGGGAGGGVNTTSAGFLASSQQRLSIDDVSHTGLDITGDMTMECWVRLDTISAFQSLMAKMDLGSNDDSFRFRIDNTNQLELTISTDGTANPTAVVAWTPSTNTWYHLAVTWQASTGNTNFYVNSVQQGTTQVVAAGGPIFNSGADFTLGGGYGLNQHFIDGNMAEARIWDVVRTQPQIEANYRELLTGTETNLQGYWRLDGDFTDQTANNNTLSDTSVVGSVSLVRDVPFGTATDLIATAGQSVDISGSTPPTVGQALVADSPTTASWQDVAASGGGGGSVAAAQGAYLTARMTTDVTATLTPPQRVPIDDVVTSRGDLVLDTTTNIGRVSGLKAGRTYALHGTVRLLNATGGFVQYRWRDVTAAADVGFSAEAYAVDGSNDQSNVHNARHTFTPDVDTEVELRILLMGDNTDDIDAFWTNITIIEIGAVQAEVVGGLEFMDMIEVTGSAVTSVTFGTGGDGAFDRALDGDLDDEYFITGDVLQAISPIDLELNPNGATTSISSELNDTTNGGNFPVSNATMRLIGGDQGVGSTLTFESTFWAKTGKRRAFVAQGASLGSSTDRRQDSAGGWQDTAANITTLEINTEQGTAGIDVGSRFFLYRRTRTNLRADSAAVYERMAMETVDPGALVTTERTVGHTVFGGSIVGVSARVEDAVTAGDITVNVKVDGVTTLTAVLDTTNTTSNVVRAPVGLHKFAPDKNVSVEFVPSSYDNAGSTPSAVTVQIHLTNDALISPPKSTQIEGALWHPPEVAHAEDDEFDGSTIDWTIDGPAPIATPIDPYNGDTSGGPRLSLNSRRKSWLMVQPAAGAGAAEFYKSYTPPTNVLVWARMLYTARLNNQYDNDASCSLRLSANDGGAPSGEDYVGLFLNENDAGTMQLNVIVREADVINVNVVGIDRFAAQYDNQPYEYLGIHKVGSVFHFWAATSQGAWVHLTSHTYVGAALAHVSVSFSNTSAAAPGNSIHGVDFIRFVESATFLP